MTDEVDSAERRQRLYLLLDDHGARTNQFEERISTEHLTIKIADEATELAEIKDDLEVLDGAIVDFHLNTSRRPDYAYLRYPCTLENCPDLISVGAPTEDVARAHAEHTWHATADIPPVDVTTGLGAMLYIKQHAPNVPLYGFCELSADHSLLFLLAARVWLGASAINAETPADEMRRALLSDYPEDGLSINAQLARAAEGFEKLTDSLQFLTRPAEAFDWLSAYRQAGYRGTLAEFKSLLNKRLGVKTLESDIYVEIMCRWQAALFRIMEAFNRDTSDWPSLRNVQSARHWDEKNPVLDFLKDYDFQTFFTAADMRAALAYHRANEKRRADEDDLGGY